MKIRDKEKKEHTHDKQHFGVPLPKCLIVDGHILTSFTMGHSEISSSSSSSSFYLSFNLVGYQVIEPVICTKKKKKEA